MRPDVESLALAEQDYRDASTRAEDLRAFRNALVRQAIGSGMTHAQVAAATGLTRGRVGQIAQRDTTAPGTSPDFDGANYGEF